MAPFPPPQAPKPPLLRCWPLTTASSTCARARGVASNVLSFPTNTNTSRRRNGRAASLCLCLHGPAPMALPPPRDVHERVTSLRRGRWRGARIWAAADGAAAVRVPACFALCALWLAGRLALGDPASFPEAASATHAHARMHARTSILSFPGHSGGVCPRVALHAVDDGLAPGRGIDMAGVMCGARGERERERETADGQAEC